MHVISHRRDQWRSTCVTGLLHAVRDVMHMRRYMHSSDVYGELCPLIVTTVPRVEPAHLQQTILCAERIPHALVVLACWPQKSYPLPSRRLAQMQRDGTHRRQSAVAARAHGCRVCARRCEPPRVCWRLHSVSSWNHGQTEAVFPEVRERAVWLVREQQKDHPCQWAAIRAIAPKLGFFRPGGARPPRALTYQFVDDHRTEFGVEPICRCLQIAPSASVRTRRCSAMPPNAVHGRSAMRAYARKCARRSMPRGVRIAPCMVHAKSGNSCSTTARRSRVARWSA